MAMTKIIDHNSGRANGLSTIPTAISSATTRVAERTIAGALAVYSDWSGFIGDKIVGFLWPIRYNRLQALGDTFYGVGAVKCGTK